MCLSIYYEREKCAPYWLDHSGGTSLIDVAFVSDETSKGPADPYRWQEHPLTDQETGEL